MAELSEWFRPSGSLARGGLSVSLTPETAGWRFCGLRVVELGPGDHEHVHSDADELLVVPLSGGFVLDVDGERLVLGGRPDVFSGTTDVAYVPPGAQVTVGSPAGGTVAIAMARAEQGAPVAARVDPPTAATFEQRGVGTHRREVRGYCMPGHHEARRLIVCEVVTPAGHWSSYPPHKHDTAGPDETELEEIYYFETSGPHGFAYFEVAASDDRPIEVLARVGTGDVALVPYGWHGPAAADPTHDLYYLNVMAGPGERDWRISVPAHFQPGLEPDAEPDLQPDAAQGRSPTDR